MSGAARTVPPALRRARGVDHPARSVGGVQLVSRRALHQAEQPGLGDVGDAGGPVLRREIAVLAVFTLVTLAYRGTRRAQAH